MADESRQETTGAMVPVEVIERKIYLVLGQKVMRDSDLAELYEVPTKALNLAVRRNLERFPADFMFQLTHEEADSLRFQSETSKPGRGGRRYLPYVFTERGVAMLSSVLNSKRAVQINIVIIRTFVRLREMLADHRELRQKVDELEREQKEQGTQIRAIFDAIRRLIKAPKEGAKRRFGFGASEEVGQG